MSAFLAVLLPSGMAAGQATATTDDESACRALVKLRHLTITSAAIAETAERRRYCYVQGNIAPAIRFHLQLPVPSRWNTRFLMIGDGGPDGVLNSANDRVDEGYAVANSNGGHDAGAEPGWSFAFNNRQAEIDYGYRAVHLTATAAKAVIRAYYGKAAGRSYFDGCSAGGRQALMEAQRYPSDFDGIVAGAPSGSFQAIQATRNWMLQRMFKDKFAANLAFDSDRDGTPDSLSKVDILHGAVLAKCDAKDGIQDGILSDPLQCDFRPSVDLAKHACPMNVDASTCFTREQLRAIEDIYAGPHDSRGKRVFKGLALGTESDWAFSFIPHAGNRMRPGYLAGHHEFANYMFFDQDPGVPPRNPENVTQALRKSGSFPEYAWWEFSIDDVTAGKGEVMRRITDATDADLRLFAATGKLLVHHGWLDTLISPEPTLDYYQRVVEQTFQGDTDLARSAVRLFMVPGMGHCGGGPGPNEWDTLSPVVDWVENGKAPDHLVAVHKTKEVVDDERKVCAHPRRAVYVGPAGGQNDRANWVEKNFECRQP